MSPSVSSWLLAVLGPCVALITACRGSTPDAVRQPRTNGTLTFKVHGSTDALDRPVVACLVVARPTDQGQHEPRAKALVNATARAGEVDGRKQFPAGTRAEAIVAYYDQLLSAHGWSANRDYVAAGNALHFYGIADLGGGSEQPQLGVHGATDSDDVPYRELAPQPW